MNGERKPRERGRSARSTAEDAMLVTDIEEVAGGEERIPPHSIELEQQVLGAMILSRQAVSKCAALIDRQVFYRGRHREIYDAIVRLYEEGKPADLSLLAEELEKKGVLEESGGPSYLADIAAAVGTSANVEYHARSLIEKAVRRRTIALSSRLNSDCFDVTGDIYVSLEQFEHELFSLAERRWQEGFVHIEPIMHRTYERIELVSRHQGDVTGVPTGYSNLDSLTAGFQPGELIIVAARPGMGKTAFCLNVARHAAVEQKLPIGFFSLEMASEAVAQRLLCLEARVDGQSVRTGRLDDAMWNRLSKAVTTLTNSPIFIDDTAGLSPLEVRAKSRRLVHEHNAQLIVVDYLQLMRLPFRMDNRALEVGEISQSLKALAKDLHIPVIAVSQVTRDVEKRGDTRPKLSDLRESGCLSGDTPVYLPDEGIYRRIDEIPAVGGVRVLAVNPETWNLERRAVLRAFPTGTKPLFRVMTRLGRVVRATANHRFLTIEGWKRLDELVPGGRIALPRYLPGPGAGEMSDSELALLGHLIGDGCTLPRHIVQYTTKDEDLAAAVSGFATAVFGDAITPRVRRERGWYQVYLPSTARLTHGKRNPIARWLDDLGVFGLRSWEKRVPERVFRQSAEGLSVFLRHLWATDGCIRLNGGRPAVYYATSSPLLARNVCSLLLRLRITATVRQVSQAGKGRAQNHVIVYGKPDIVRFLNLIGGFGKTRSAQEADIRERLAACVANTNRDVIPREAWKLIVIPAMRSEGITTRGMHAAIDTSYSGTSLYRSALGRERAERVAAAVHSPELDRLARSDVYWDEITSIDPDGMEPVYDLTVEGPHNFVAGDVVVHNSIEQDADVVIFVHRPEYYGITQDEEGRSLEGVAEIVVEKQRNGPTGKILLRWDNKFGRFDPLALDDGYAPDELGVEEEDEAPF